MFIQVRSILFLGIASLFPLFTLAPISLAQSSNEPIIDMHLYALHVDEQGPPPVFICAPYPSWPSRDAKTSGEDYSKALLRTPPCSSPLSSPMSDEELMQRTIQIMKARNVVGLASGSLEVVDRWREAGGSRILPSIAFDPKSGKPTVDELRRLVLEKRVVALAEIVTQLAPSDTPESLMTGFPYLRRGKMNPCP